MSPTDWRFWSALFAAMIFLGYPAAADQSACDSPQDPEAAIRLVASDCPHSFDEWDAANAELKALGVVP
jgi:hypothetical protein